MGWVTLTRSLVPNPGHIYFSEITELAYFAQMSSADVSRIESGRMVPYPGHAQRLARVRGLDPSEMLEEVDMPVRQAVGG